MFTVAQSSHNPALFRPTTLGVVATREDARAFIEARGFVIVCFELDGPDAADCAAAKGADLSIFTIEKIREII